MRTPSNKANPHTPHIGPDGKLWTCAGGPFLVIGYGYDWRQAWADWKAERDRRIASAERATPDGLWIRTGGPLTFTLGQPVETNHV